MRLPVGCEAANFIVVAVRIGALVVTVVALTAGFGVGTTTVEGSLFAVGRPAPDPLLAPAATATIESGAPEADALAAAALSPVSTGVSASAGTALGVDGGNEAAGAGSISPIPTTATSIVAPIAASDRLAFGAASSVAA
jgi:hypothetical protein